MVKRLHHNVSGMYSIHNLDIRYEQKKKQDKFKNWPLIKNSQVLVNPFETWWKWLAHEIIIFTKFHKDWTKIVDLLLMANFLACPFFFAQTLVLLSIIIITIGPCCPLEKGRKKYVAGFLLTGCYGCLSICLSEKFLKDGCSLSKQAPQNLKASAPKVPNS